MRTWNHVNGYQLANTAGGGSTGVGGSLDGRDITAHDRGHVAGANLFPPDERDLRGLDATRPFVSIIPSASPIVSSQLTTADRQSLSCFIASAIRAVSSPYVSRISPSLLAVASALRASATGRGTAPETFGTRRSVGDVGASSTWHST